MFDTLATFFSTPGLVPILAAIIAIAVIIHAGVSVIHIARHYNELTGKPPVDDATLHDDDTPPPPHSTTKFELAVIGLGLAAAMVFLDDGQETVAIQHAATAAQRADVQRLRTLNDIVNHRCPAPDAIEREIVLIDWHTSADMHTPTGTHISCERYSQSGWYIGER